MKINAIVLVFSVLVLISTAGSGQCPTKNSQNDVGGKDAVLIEAFGPEVRQVTLLHKTFSPDGRTYVGYYRDGWDEVISVHDTKTRKQMRRVLCHGDNVQEFRFTPDGQTLASRCAKKGWALWDVSTGKLLLRLPLPNAET